MKSFLIITLLLGSVSAWSLTEAEYLAKNKTYTDGLLQYLQFEDKANIDMASLKTTKKSADAALKKATADLSVTTQQLTKEQDRLTSLKDKKLNKTQLEASLNSQKQQNQSKINTLNGQIANTNSSLQSVQQTISQLQNEKSVIQNKVNTQEQVVRFVQGNVDDLEREIWLLENEIRDNDRRIRNNQQDIANLKAQKEATEDPVQKAALQAQIEEKKIRIDELERENNRLENRLSTKEFQLSDEKSQLNREKNKLAILNIELDGKQNEINSQVRVENQLEDNIANYQAQKSNLNQKNSNINAELDVLANIDSYIAASEQKIQSLATLKGQQDTAAAKAQSDVTTTVTAISQLQQKIDTSKAAALASEKEHDSALKEFSATAAVVTPVVLDEMTVSIDSLVVTEELAKLKDWTVFRGVSTTLDGANVCAASTQVLDTKTGVLSELLVVKLIDGSGVYSSPFIMTTHSRIPDLVVKGQLKTDKAKGVVMPLLQSPVANEKALITRYSDAATLISYLKAHNSAKVEFSVPGAPVTVPFSLRGSSAMVNAMLEKCKN